MSKVSNELLDDCLTKLLAYSAGEKIDRDEGEVQGALGQAGPLRNLGRRMRAGARATAREN